MTQDMGKASGKPRTGYIWDAEKLAWVQVGDTAPDEASHQIAESTKAEVAEFESADEAIEGEPLEETGSVVEATEVWRLTYKGALIRMAGALVDLIIMLVINTIISYTIGRLVDLPDYLLPIYGLLYFVGFWWWRGQTPGKMLVRAKVVRTDGSDIGIGRALLRWLFYFMPAYAPITFLAGFVGTWAMILLPLVSILVIAFTREKRGIHDFIAGTAVLDTRPILLPTQEESS